MYCDKDYFYKFLNFKAIACGDNHSVALRYDGTIVTWGDNNYSQRHNVPKEKSFTSIACGKHHSVALHESGYVVTWGCFNEMNDTPKNAVFKKICCGYYHSVALDEDGYIMTWGDNIGDQKSNQPIDNNFIDIACGAYHSVALKNNGSIVIWGSNRREQRLHVPQSKNFIQISCGLFHSAALRSDGRVFIWGKFRFDHKTHNCKSISCGDNHICILDSNYIKTCYVDSTEKTHYELTNGYNKVVSGPDYYVLIKNNGTVEMLGKSPVLEGLPTDNNFIDVSCGTHHCVGLRRNGSVVTWGLNSSNQLEGSPEDKSYRYPIIPLLIILLIFYHLLIN